MGFNSAFKGLIYSNNISSAFFSRTYRADAQLDIHVYWNILTMHEPINVKSPNNTSKWQMGFNSAFKGLMNCVVHDGTPLDTFI
jgi:hypothetical protein